MSSGRDTSPTGPHLPRPSAELMPRSRSAQVQSSAETVCVTPQHGAPSSERRGVRRAEREARLLCEEEPPRQGPVQLDEHSALEQSRARDLPSFCRGTNDHLNFLGGLPGFFQLCKPLSALLTMSLC